MGGMLRSGEGGKEMERERRRDMVAQCQVQLYGTVPSRSVERGAGLSRTESEQEKGTWRLLTANYILMVPLCSCCSAPGKLKRSGCRAVGLNVPYCSVKHQKLVRPYPDAVSRLFA